jgi:hypothetical protein
MKKLFKCSVCNLIYEGEQAADQCPKCGQPHDKFVELTAEEANKVYQSERTNDIHMELIELAARIVRLSNEGIEINLDPPCAAGFIRARDAAYSIKQQAKAELENHMKKGKW